MIAQQQYDSAAGLLNEITEPGAYRYLYTELQGDVALAQQQPAQAAKAYEQALEQMPAQASNRAFLTSKYENVAGAVDVGQ